MDKRVLTEALLSRRQRGLNPARLATASSGLEQQQQQKPSPSTLSTAADAPSPFKPNRAGQRNEAEQQGAPDCARLPDGWRRADGGRPMRPAAGDPAPLRRLFHPLAVILRPRAGSCGGPRVYTALSQPSRAAVGLRCHPPGAPDHQRSINSTGVAQSGAQACQVSGGGRRSTPAPPAAGGSQLSAPALSSSSASCWGRFAIFMHQLHWAAPSAAASLLGELTRPLARRCAPHQQPGSGRPLSNSTVHLFCCCTLA